MSPVKEWSMRALGILHYFFMFFAITGLLLIGYSYINIVDETIFMVAGSALTGLSLVIWFAVLWKTYGIAAKGRQVVPSFLNLIKMIHWLPELLKHAGAGRNCKGVDRPLSSAVILLFILLPLSIALLPFAATSVLMALLMGMWRLARQWKKALPTTESMDSGPPQVSPAMKSAGSFRATLETLGNLIFLMLVAFLVTVAFNVFYIMPYEGYRSRVQKISLETQLTNANGAAFEYLRKHPGQKVNSAGQLSEGGWRETPRVRFVAADMSEKGGTIALKYVAPSRFRHEMATGIIISDGKISRVVFKP